MDLKTIALYVGVALASAGLAYFVFADKKSNDPNPPLNVEEIDDPAWYRTASYGTRLAALQVRLAKMTSRSIAPEKAGPTKDEIALLCRDEALVDVVIDSFKSHPRLTPALLSAFMEIFGRVKNPKFAPLLERGFKSKEFDVRMNAADAGIIHGDSRSIEEMGDALLTASGAQANRLLTSVITVGGDEAMNYLEAVVLQRKEIELVVPSMKALGNARYHNAVESIRTKINDDEDSVMLASCMALAMLGQQDGYSKLVKLASDPNGDPLIRAESLQYLFIASGSKNKDLYLKLKDETSQIGFEARLALVKLRDTETVAETRKLALEGNRLQQIESVGLLGASGDPDDIEFLAKHVEEMNTYMIRACLSSMKRGRAPNLGKVLVALASSARPETSTVFSAIPEFPPTFILDLEPVLLAEKNPVRRDIILRSISSCPCKESLEIIERFDPGNDRELWLLIRSLIRKLDLLLLKQ